MPDRGSRVERETESVRPSYFQILRDSLQIARASIGQVPTLVQHDVGYARQSSKTRCKADDQIDRELPSPRVPIVNTTGRGNPRAPIGIPIDRGSVVLVRPDESHTQHNFSLIASPYSTSFGDKRKFFASGPTSPRGTSGERREIPRSDNLKNASAFLIYFEHHLQGLVTYATTTVKLNKRQSVQQGLIKYISSTTQRGSTHLSANRSQLIDCDQIRHNLRSLRTLTISSVHVEAASIHDIRSNRRDAAFTNIMDDIVSYRRSHKH
ncbi:unnamed protein product [Trichogramma brassicae]|uniref:Uncharacterized protein n=1 Tax=Trichogramma brassicae TaxID=86971 RepID=A0A6H5IFN6_9HYME|nr:unnamed protein product [Trichogramma brassicae]